MKQWSANKVFDNFTDRNNIGEDSLTLVSHHDIMFLQTETIEKIF